MTSDPNTHTQDHNGEWGHWFRASCDKWLLTWIMGMLLVYNLHIMHDKADLAQIQFINGLIHTVSGALMVLVTQQIRSDIKAKATTKDDLKGGTVGTLELKKDD